MFHPFLQTFFAKKKFNENFFLTQIISIKNFMSTNIFGPKIFLIDFFASIIFVANVFWRRKKFYQIFKNWKWSFQIADTRELLIVFSNSNISHPPPSFRFCPPENKYMNLKPGCDNNKLLNVFFRITPECPQAQNHPDWSTAKFWVLLPRQLYWWLPPQQAEI